MLPYGEVRGPTVAVWPPEDAVSAEDVEALPGMAALVGAPESVSVSGGMIVGSKLGYELIPEAIELSIPVLAVESPADWLRGRAGVDMLPKMTFGSELHRATTSEMPSAVDVVAGTE